MKYLLIVMMFIACNAYGQNDSLKIKIDPFRSGKIRFTFNQNKDGENPIMCEIIGDTIYIPSKFNAKIKFEVRGYFISHADNICDTFIGGHTLRDMRYEQLYHQK